MHQKSPEAFRTISEVATDLNVPQHVLRFWESKFRQIKPLKRGGGRRYYRPEDVNLLRGVQSLLYTDGYTIKGVQKVFKNQGAQFVIDTGRGIADSVIAPRVPENVAPNVTPNVTIDAAERPSDEDGPFAHKEGGQADKEGGRAHKEGGRSEALRVLDAAARENLEAIARRLDSLREALTNARPKQ